MALLCGHALNNHKRRIPARAVVEKVLEAQGLGAIACIIVHNCYAFFAPKVRKAPSWPKSWANFSLF